jgi:hypothetical protein
MSLHLDRLWHSYLLFLVDSQTIVCSLGPFDFHENHLLPSKLPTSPPQFPIPYKEGYTSFWISLAYLYYFLWCPHKNYSVCLLLLICQLLIHFSKLSDGKEEISLTPSQPHREGGKFINYMLLYFTGRKNSYVSLSPLVSCFSVSHRNQNVITQGPIRTENHTLIWTGKIHEPFKL